MRLFRNVQAPKEEEKQATTAQHAQEKTKLNKGMAKMFMYKNEHNNVDISFEKWTNEQKEMLV